MNDNKVISLRFAHFSYEKCCGYNLPIPEMIAQFFEYMRGIGPDAFIIKRYRLNEEGTLTTDEIMRGCVPTSANDKKTIRQAQVNLSSELDARAEEAREYIRDETSRVYELLNRGNNVIFVRCSEGIMGCGWFDSAHTLRKGLKLAAFMLYVLGSINKWDNILLTAVWNYLPYESTFSFAESEKASDIIAMVLADKAVTQNKGRPFVVMS